MIDPDLQVQEGFSLSIERINLLSVRPVPQLHYDGLFRFLFEGQESAAMASWAVEVIPRRYLLN